MTAGEHEMPPHQERYLEALGDPGKVSEPPAPAATTGKGYRVTITPGYDAGHYLDQVGTPIPGQQIPWGVQRDLYTKPCGTTAEPNTDPARHAEAIEADGHVDPVAAARWRQAQTELAGLIREQNQATARDPQATPVLPDKLGPWMENRVAELEQAAASEPEIEP